MSKLFAIITIVLVTLSFNAQTPESSGGAETNADENKKVETPGSSVSETPNSDDLRVVPASKSKPIKIPLTIDPPVIDGNPDEAIWKTAAAFKDFIQTGPGDNIPPSKKTEAYMMYDTKNLYIAFKCWDDKDGIRATVAKRDQVTGEDNVRVWLDTYDDQRRAYILAFNPLGIQQDGIYTEGQGNDYSVDIVMESKGKIYDWGWTVEVKIPFKSLRYSAGEGKNWGFNVARNIDRLNDEFDSWMPNDRNISGSLIQHGRITGLNEIKSERTLELVPSVTISETGSRVPANEVATGRFVNQPIKQEYGLNLKYTITPNVTLDAAINPDFAEIEADAPVVRANQRFPIFFEEKRPFFLEGIDIFQSPLRVFNSRSIIDPDFAAKLTGKVGKNSFGFLVASDNAPGNFDSDSRIDPDVRPFIDEFVDKNALFSVVRLKRDIGKENSVGFFGTARVFPENKNFLGGFDGSFKLNPKTNLTFQAVGSHSRKCYFDPDFDDVANPFQAERNGQICGGGIVGGVQELGSVYNTYRTGNGFAYDINVNSSGSTSGYWIGAGGKTADYRSDVGFNRRTDNNYAFFGFRRSTTSKPKNRIIRANWNNNFNLNYDWRGRLQNTNYNTNINLNLQRNSFINFWAGIERDVLYEEEFGLARNANRDGTFFGDNTRQETQPFFGVFARTQLDQKITFGGQLGFGFNVFDFDFGAGPRYPRVSPAGLADPDAPLDPGPGRRINMSSFLEYNPTDPLRISLNFNKTILRRNETGRTAFDVNIFSLRSTYQFTRFIFARARIDYNTLRSNVNGQYLFGWAPSPGKAFYVGYNDNSSYNGFNPFTGDLEPGFARNRRTFFIRMSYLFRKSF